MQCCSWICYCCIGSTLERLRLATSNTTGNQCITLVMQRQLRQVELQLVRTLGKANVLWRGQQLSIQPWSSRVKQFTLGNHYLHKYLGTQLHTPPGLYIGVSAFNGRGLSVLSAYRSLSMMIAPPGPLYRSIDQTGRTRPRPVGRIHQWESCLALLAPT